MPTTSEAISPNPWAPHAPPSDVRILHWFRKDLRLDDNPALAAAASDADGNVVTVYLSEPAVLGRPDHAAVRFQFVLDSLAALGRDVADVGGRLLLRHGDADVAIPALAREVGADAVSWNAEYEPALRERDARVRRELAAAGIAVREHHDRFLVAPGAVRTGAGTPYTVFTPFRKACAAHAVLAPLPRVTRLAGATMPSRRPATLAELGHCLDVPAWPAGSAAARRALDRFLAEALTDYKSARDLLAAPGTSRLSHHLRFGTLSARQAYHATVSAMMDASGAGGGTGAERTASAEHFISELRWRDFFGHVLHHHPHVLAGCFRREYDGIRWIDDGEAFAAWCEGRTGYPIVDAGMRELRATGWMHNRARMITASFLTKDLLIDWRRGERWFMNHLVDGDPASNNGGWQWAASTGTDAQPYFRIFNPVLQGRRFDADGRYVRRWIPELAGLPDAWLHAPWEAPPLELAAAGVTLDANYPAPICDHAQRKALALALYREAATGREPGLSGRST